MFHRLSVKDSNCDFLDKTILDLSASSSLKTVESILQEFPEITLPMLYNRPVKHDVTHIIDTAGLPISCRPRPLSPEMLKITQEQFQDMLEKGTVESRTGPWSSPLHLVKKKEWQLSLCGRLPSTE